MTPAGCDDLPVTNHARAERLALCTTLERVGPAASTLCEGWLTRDLAAHLVLRENRPDVHLGMQVPTLAERVKGLRGAAVERPFDELVQTVRSGPPSWHPTRLSVVDKVVNTAEFFVHHEDVLRAQASWTPRPLSVDLQRSLWRVCSSVGRLALRRAPVGVELVSPGYGRVVVRRGEPVVQVEGPPAEVLLYAFGRRSAAQVQLTGPVAAIDLLSEAPLGL